MLEAGEACTDDGDDESCCEHLVLLLCDVIMVYLIWQQQLD